MEYVGCFKEAHLKHKAQSDCLNSLPHPPVRFQQRGFGRRAAASMLTARWCGVDMNDPDSTRQQLSTIVAGLNCNHCGVWSLDRLWSRPETKELRSSPVVQQETPCWKCHSPNCPQSCFSQIAQAT